MKAGSAAKLIVDALLQRFLPLARRRIETAQVQVSFFLCVRVVGCGEGKGAVYNHVFVHCCIRYAMGCLLC